MELLSILGGWKITPDTLVSLWLAFKLTGVQSYLKDLIHNHDKRIAILEKETEKDG